MASGNAADLAEAVESTKQSPLPKLARRDSPIFAIDGLTHAIRQGEIISDLIQYEYHFEQAGAIGKKHPFVIVASQDCDLDWDFKNRATGDDSGEGKRLPNVFLYEALQSPDVSALVKPNILKRIKQSDDVRYAFLEAADTTVDLLECGLPELVVDFKRYFTITTEELYRQVADKSPESAQRRCCLVSPYLEHFQTRACSFQARVALPLDHESAPAKP